MKTLASQGLIIAGTVLMLGAGKVYAAQYELKSEGIKCAKCISKIEEALKNLEGINSVKANLNGEVYVDLDSQKVNLEDITDTIEGIDSGKFKVQEATQTINVKGMTCGACANRVKNALTKLGVKDAKVSLKENRATVTYDPEKVTTAQMVDAVSRSGFKASLPE